MAVNAHRPTMTAVQATDTTSPGGHVVASEGRRAEVACGMDKSGRTGLFLMAACCAAPLLLVLALPVLGTGLGSRAAPVVNTLAVFACPVGMALMMWMMRRQGAGAQQPIQEMASTAPPVPAINRHQGAVSPLANGSDEAVLSHQG